MTGNKEWLKITILDFKQYCFYTENGVNGSCPKSTGSCPKSTFLNSSVNQFISFLWNVWTLRKICIFLKVG